MTQSIKSHPLELKLVTNDTEKIVPLQNPLQVAVLPTFGRDEPNGLYDLYIIAIAMHEVERELHQNAKVRKGIKKVTIPLTHKTLKDIDEGAVSDILRGLSLAIFSKDIEFGFEHHSHYQTDFKKDYDEHNAVCLFSGGADSFVGVLDSKDKYNDIIALNIRHDHSATVNSYVVNLDNRVLAPESIPLERIDVPKQIGKGYSQTRGILYQTCAGISAFRHSSRRVVLSECGTTMYQPSFGLFDRVTYTSDPVVQVASQRLIQEILDYRIEIITPFEDCTKSEMFASSRHKELIKDTFSCISSRFGQNLGCCYGCVIRRIGFIVSGLEDCQYRYDIFSINDDEQLPRYGRGRGGGKITDFLELMRFSLDLLVDYESINPVKRRRIDRYHKYDLFRRFALDTFASLSIVSENNGLQNSRLKSAYHDALNFINESDIEKRIEDVRDLSK